MINWNTSKGIRLAERMGYDAHSWTPEALNDFARRLGEKHGFNIEYCPFRRRYFIYRVINLNGAMLRYEDGFESHTSASMAMAELALKEEGR